MDFIEVGYFTGRAKFQDLLPSCIRPTERDVVCVCVCVRGGGGGGGVGQNSDKNYLKNSKENINCKTESE